MITVTKALSLLSEISYTPIPTSIALRKAKGLLLAEDVVSQIHMPPFRQSAMDGYALAVSDGATYEVIGEVKAGDAHDYELQPGQAVRIFTGARVPNMADTVIMQEKVTRQQTQITISGTIDTNQNIRPVGEQIQKGAIALEKGTPLSPAGIGFLAGLGVDQVSVYPAPSIGIIVTGSELVSPGNDLPLGKIYESNAIQLETALQEFPISNCKTYTVVDDYTATKECIATAIRDNDIVLISGGISVGDYDFVQQALLELQTTPLFYKIKQKPGKPLFFGQHKDALVFALPGNPASSLTCFYIYVVPILQKVMGYPDTGLPRTKKIITSTFHKKGDRAQFLKALVYGDTVKILEGQSSAMLHTYAIANALVYIPEHVDLVESGDDVDVILLS